MSSILVCRDAMHGHEYFTTNAHTLFPQWPEDRDSQIIGLLAMTRLHTLYPQSSRHVLVLATRSLRDRFGGVGRFLISVLLEQLFSIVLAPTMMLFHTAFVVSTLVGRSVAWGTQDREDRNVDFRQALARHWWHVLLGVIWGSIILLLAPRYIWWILPLLAGFILSVPLTMLTSWVSLGRWHAGMDSCSHPRRPLRRVSSLR